MSCAIDGAASAAALGVGDVTLGECSSILAGNVSGVAAGEGTGAPLTCAKSIGTAILWHPGAPSRPRGRVLRSQVGHI